MLQQCTNKTLTTIPFGNTYKEDEVSPRGREGCRTQVSTTKLGHRSVITVLNRIVKQQYALVPECHSHRRPNPLL
jgi:hypothetical protein